MTPFEADVMRYMALRDAPVSWAELRGQFTVSEGYLSVIITTLKRQLLVMQDGLAYRLSSVGEAELRPRPRRAAFEGRAAW